MDKISVGEEMRYSNKIGLWGSGVENLDSNNKRFKPLGPLRSDAGNSGRKLSPEEFPSCTLRVLAQARLQMEGQKPPEVLLINIEGALKIWFHSFSFLYFLRPGEKRQTHT